jgi:hypothetical protein
MLSTATLAMANSRYYSHGQGDYYRGHHAPYNYHHYRYSHHADGYWPFLGIGLLTGAVLGSVMYQPPGQQTIIYNPPPPVIVHSEPMVVNRSVASVIPPPEVVLKQVKITEKIVNVRSGPGLDAAIIGQALVGQTVDVIGAAPDWLYIRTKTGQYGWVMSRYTADSGGPVG